MNKVVMGRRMPGFMILAIALAALVFSAACSKNANTGNSTNSVNSTSTTSSTNSSTSSSTTGTGPTAALRAYYQAAINKDMATAKRYLSAGTMEMMEEGAKKMGKTVDEALKDSPPTPMPEFSNEKINGDTATVDIKSEGMTVTMPMVKEGGEWKLAMDKMIKDMQNSMGGSQPKAPTESQDDDDDTSGNHNSGH